MVSGARSSRCRCLFTSMLSMAYGVRTFMDVRGHVQLGGDTDMLILQLLLDKRHEPVGGIAHWVCSSCLFCSFSLFDCGEVMA